MKTKKLILIFVIMLISLQTAYALQEIVVLNIDVYREGKVEIVDYSVGEGTESLELVEQERSFKIEILSKNNEILYSKYFEAAFDIHLDILPGQPPAEGIIPTEKKGMVLKIPFFEEIKLIKFYYKRKLILQEQLKFCNNNGVCEANNKENLLSCPNDCESGTEDNYCDAVLDGKCDQDCVNQGRMEKDIDCTCGNNVCDERENEKTCREDCKLSLWKIIINFIKSLFK